MKFFSKPQKPHCWAIFGSSRPDEPFFKKLGFVNFLIFWLSNFTEKIRKKCRANSQILDSWNILHQPFLHKKKYNTYLSK